MLRIDKISFSYILLIAILLIHVFLLSKLVFFPYPELFIYPYLTNKGLLPYNQILDQHFPGFLFLPINFDNLGMNNEVIARVWLYGIVIIIHLFLFFISKKILGKKKALLVNILYLLWQPFFEGWVLWIDNFLPLLLLPAFYFLLKKKFFLTGIFLGTAIVMKQTIIPLAGLIFLYILWEKNIRWLGNYILGISIPVLLMLLYLISRNIFSDFWYWTVVFNLTTYAKYGTQIPTSFGFISRVLVVYAASTTVFFYKDRNLKILLFLFLIGSLAGAFDRSNFVHFQPPLPFTVIATVLGLYSLFKKKVGLILIGVYIFIAIWWQNVFYKGHISDYIFFFDDQTYAISAKIRQYTKVGDKIFVFGAAPHLYQMSQTLPAGDIFVFQFPWFMRVVEDRILEGIKKDKPNIVVYDSTVAIEDQRITDFAKKINLYIENNYEKIDAQGTTDILRRKS